MRSSDFVNHSYNREEKSLRHVAMVATFLDDNKPKRHLQVDSHCFKLHRSYLISFNLSNVGEIFWVKSERTACNFRERKLKFLCCAHVLHKAGAWNWEVSCRGRATTAEKCTKKREARAKMFFCQSKLTVLFAVRRPRCKNFLLLSSGNFATMVTWRYTSLYYSQIGLHSVLLPLLITWEKTSRASRKKFLWARIHPEGKTKTVTYNQQQFLTS